jgi:putative DNA primase/helicase
MGIPAEATVMNAAEISQQLQGHRSGAGYVARCPAHDDNNPSLSLKDEDGKILVHCHAGCEQRAVVEALKALGLWPEPEERADRLIVAEYNYTDEAGDLLYQVVRQEPKRFLQRFPDRAGGWIYLALPRVFCSIV